MVVIYNSLIRLPIVKHLEGSGNNITPITDGSFALNKLSEGSIDCIILDLNLPAIVNGIELLKKVKVGYSDIPIIIINSNLDENIINALIKIGVKDIVTTPVDVERLSRIIESIS